MGFLYSGLRYVYRATKAFFKWNVSVLKNLKYICPISKEQTYYPKKTRKCFLSRVCDNLIWLLKHGEVNKFYTQYGFDLKSSDSSDHIAFYEFMRLRNSFNQVSRFDNSIGILRDKFLFFKYMKANGLSSPQVFACMQKGKIYDCWLENYDEESLKQEKDYFVKDVSGECASFVKHVYDYDQLQNFLPLMGGEMYLFQRKINQHPEMNRLNPNAVNTIRIVTINDKNKPYVFAAILRIGTKISGCADNTSAGGIAVGVRKDGHLMDCGMMKPQYGTICKVHPDTKIIFSEFQIPYYKEALDLVCRAHRFFYGVKSIGWDVAIAEEGPTIIEGNDNWEITSIQAIYGGKKKELYAMMVQG